MTIKNFYHENPFESYAGKFPDPDFNLAPPYRGFWTDEEVFQILGTTSLVVLKSLQRKKLLHVSKYKNRSGKWTRAWTYIDVYLAALTIDLSFHASLSVAASAEVLSLIPESLARRSLSLEPFLDQLLDPYVAHSK
jgi:hypothetical protein